MVSAQPSFPSERDPERDPGVTSRPFLRSRNRRLILDYSLVLLSQDIDHEIDEAGGRYAIWLNEDRREDAKRILHAYVRENKGFNTEIPAPSLHLLLSPLLFLVWPISFHFWVGFSDWPMAWKESGSAHAKRILEGEWWRILTATTLHADHGHFLSNLFSGYFMLNLLAHRLGMGTILCVGVLASMAANLSVALTSAGNHVSIGFSTTVFAALGMLAGVETLHRPKTPGLKFRHVHPLLAAFAVAVLMGIGQDVDIKAHFFGFGFGAIGGLATRRLPVRIRESKPQFLLGAFAFVAYALSWNAAMGWIRF